MAGSRGLSLCILAFCLAGPSFVRSQKVSVTRLGGGGVRRPSIYTDWLQLWGLALHELDLGTGWPRPVLVTSDCGRVPTFKWLVDSHIVWIAALRYSGLRLRGPESILPSLPR